MARLSRDQETLVTPPKEAPKLKVGTTRRKEERTQRQMNI